METQLSGTEDQIEVDDLIDELNEQEATMMEAVAHPWVGNELGGEALWFNFSDYYDDLPVAGFFKGKAVFLTAGLEWEARTEDELENWKREEENNQ